MPTKIPPFILASASPRRSDLLASAGLRFEVDPSQADERLLPGEEPRAYTRRVAGDKCAEVAARRRSAGDDRLVLAADTTVAVDGLILGKPDGREGAGAMIRALEGREHRVITGYCLRGPREREVRDEVVTRVVFRSLTEEEIEAYLDIARWGDKAGGYAIQGSAAHMVSAVYGSYTNVVGLPLAEVVAALRAVCRELPEA